MRSAVGKGAGCAPTPTRVRVLTPAGAHRGFSLVYSRSQVGLCLTRGWPTMIRLTCLSHSEPGGDFGDLSAACIPRCRCRFSSRTVCVCGCVSVVLVWVCAWVQILQFVLEGLRPKKKIFFRYIEPCRHTDEQNFYLLINHIIMFQATR